MILQTPRLDIRELTGDDLDAFAALLADPLVMEFSLNGPVDRVGAQRYLQKNILDHYREHGYGLWALVERSQGKVIGFAGLSHQEVEGEAFVEFGYRLSPKLWGEGYVTEAGQAIRDYAFEVVGVETLISIIDPKNTRSVAVAERVGLTLWRNAVYHGHSVTLYALSRAT